jgi:hypothetical protein
MPTVAFWALSGETSRLSIREMDESITLMNQAIFIKEHSESRHKVINLVE